MFSFSFLFCIQFACRGRHSFWLRIDTIARVHCLHVCVGWWHRFTPTHVTRTRACNDLCLVYRLQCRLKTIVQFDRDLRPRRFSILKMDRPAAVRPEAELDPISGCLSELGMRISLLRVCDWTESQYVTQLIMARSSGLGGVVVLAESMIVRVCVARQAVRNATTREDLTRASADVLEAHRRIASVRALVAMFETDNGADESDVDSDTDSDI